MIEGDFNVIDILYPGDGFSVVPGSCFCCGLDVYKKCDRADMTARITVGL